MLSQQGKKNFKARNQGHQVKELLKAKNGKRWEAVQEKIKQLIKERNKKYQCKEK